MPWCWAFSDGWFRLSPTPLRITWKASQSPQVCRPRYEKRAQLPDQIMFQNLNWGKENEKIIDHAGAVDFYFCIACTSRSASDQFLHTECNSLHIFFRFFITRHHV